MIRFGIIGTNWITEKFIEAANQLGGCTLTAVYSRTEERAQEFAGKHGAELTFTDLKEMARSSEIDAVYIASPNSLHASQAMIFMDQGKHVLCEKPMASNSAEVEQMIDCAKRNRVVLMEAIKGMFMPNFSAVKKHLHKIGKVRRVVFNNGRYSSRYDDFKAGNKVNAFERAFSNGALMDIGIYCLYPLIYLFGKPDQMKASSLLLESGVDGQGSILFEYEEMEAVVMYSKIATSHLPSEIQGEEGTILIHKISAPGKVEIHFRNGEYEDISEPQVENTMYYEVKEFLDLINNGEIQSKINSFALSQQNAILMKQIRDEINLVFPADKVSG